MYFLVCCKFHWSSLQVLDDLMESGSSTTGTDPTDEIREQPVAEQNPVDQKELCSRTIQTTYDLVVSIYNMTII